MLRAMHFSGDPVTWRPLSVRNGSADAPAKYDALHEGVPEWMHASLERWIDGFLWFTGNYRSINIGRLEQIERKLRVRLDWAGEGETAREGLLLEAFKNDGLALDVADLLLHECGDLGDAPAVLEQILADAGSAWRVVRVNGRYALVRRLAEAVQGSVDQAIAADQRAGHFLQDSFITCYGRDPDPSVAYREAIRAVEAVACPALLPDNRAATLGTVRACLEQGPDEKFAITLGEIQSEVGPRTNPRITLAHMTGLLWKSQFDRHGAGDEPTPPGITREQAEAALHLASTLVLWFARGYVRLATQ
jgi:hypothetical protein